MNLNEWFQFNEKSFPELIEEVKKRQELADKYAGQDSPVLNQPINELKGIYLELLMNICLEEGLVKFEQIAPQARYTTAAGNIAADMKYHFRIRRDAMIEWLQPPPIPFKIESQTRKRFSEILPVNPFLHVAFRILRLCFGETGRVSQFTRSWLCLWKATILIGPARGASRTSRSRDDLLKWEEKCFFSLNGLNLDL